MKVIIISDFEEIEEVPEQRNRYVRDFVRRCWKSEFPPLPELKASL